MKSLNNIYFTVSNYDHHKVIEYFNSDRLYIEVFYKKDRIIYKTSIDDYQKVKKNYPFLDIKTIQLTNQLYFKSLIKKYYLAFILTLMGIFLITLLSFFIVDIDIQTSDFELAILVSKILDEQGIKSFSIKKNYDQLQTIKDSIKQQYYDDIDWIEIKTLGMKYIVNVEKKVINKPVKEPQYCNVYSNKDGMVKRVKTHRGVSMVSMNDYVTRGDLLISGDILFKDEIVHQVCAEGDVYAEVWYTINIKIPLNYYTYEKTGKKRKNYLFKYNGNDYVLFKNRIKSYKSNEKLLYEVIGLKFYERTDEEIIKKAQNYSYDEAIKQALNEASEKIQIKLDDDEKIIMQKVLQKQVIDSTINVDIFIVTEEKIGYQNIEE